MIIAATQWTYQMGGAKLEGCAPGVQAEDIDVELQMCDDSFSNDRISIDYESYEYRFVCPFFSPFLTFFLNIRGCF